MLIAQAVAKVGSDAVAHFMAARGVANETLIGETNLTGFVARQLAAQGWNTSSEHDYQRIAIDRCGLVDDADLVHEFGGCRADVLAAAPGATNRLAIVELKVVDESRPWHGIKADHDRIRRFQTFLRARGSLVTIDGYVGGLICDLSNGTEAEATCERLRAELGDVAFACGERTAAVGGGWGWRFICGKMADLP
jgi:hypothetical protein